MTPTGIIRKIKAICRENIAVFTRLEQTKDCRKWKGAAGECRGSIETSREILREIRIAERKGRKA